MKSIACTYLNNDSLTHVVMLESINRDNALIYHASEDGVVLRNRSSDILMISARTPKLYEWAVVNYPQEKICLIHQPWAADIIEKGYHIPVNMTCVNALYLHSQQTLPASKLTMRPLHEDNFAFLKTHYHADLDDDYLIERLQQRVIIGAFLDQECVGFIGEHDEGSIGMLVVVEKHRKQGFAQELLNYKCADQLRHGLLPFSQIEVQNTASINLHQKAGFTISSNPILWCIENS